MAQLPAFDPRLPFVGQIPGGFRPGLMVRIQGKTGSGRDKRMMIDFLNSPSKANQDIVLHLSIRPDEKAIVRNHFQNGKWANEERDGPAPKANESFEIIVLAEHDCYKIALNGQHIASFQHRLPLHLVQYVKVSGDHAQVNSIHLEQDMHGGPQEMQMMHEVEEIGVTEFSTPSHTMMQMRIGTPSQHHHQQQPYNPQYPQSGYRPY